MILTMISRYTFIILLLLQNISSKSNNATDYCMSTDENPYMLGGTITSYKFVRGNTLPTRNATHKQIMLWAVIRHGTRNPSRTEISQMELVKALQAKLMESVEINRNKVQLCNQDLEAIKNWEWDDSMYENADQMTAVGLQEMFELGKQYSSTYPTLLDESSNSKKYFFEYTLVRRTYDSMQMFVRGLFGENATYTSTVNNKTILGLWNCKKWLKEAPDIKQHYLKQFEKSTLFHNVLSAVSEKLGMKLSSEELHAIYTNCRYDRTRHHLSLSPWCSVFDRKQMMIMEYGQDLDTYYLTGPGKEINVMLGCYVVKHLMETITNFVETKVFDKKVHLLFGHDVTLNMMMAYMKAFKDIYPLEMDNDYLLSNRKYRDSLHTPFAANLAVVLYDITQSNELRPHESCEEKYVVQFLLNERPMQLKGCSTDGMCSWGHLKKILTPNCTFEICNE